MSGTAGFLPLGPTEMEKLYNAAGIVGAMWAVDKFGGFGEMQLMSYGIIAAVLYFLPTAVRAHIRAYLPDALTSMGIGAGALVAASLYAYLHAGEAALSTEGAVLVGVGLLAYLAASKIVPEVETYFHQPPATKGPALF